MVLDGRAWRHLLEKHVLCGQEPWEGLFSAEILDALTKSDQRNDLGDAVTARAVAELEAQVRASLNRPLVLLYRSQPLGSPPPRSLPQWLLVLPAGATAYVQEGTRGNRLATCYFSRAAIVESRGERRWQAVVRRLVLRYGILDPAKNALVPPGANTVKPLPAKGPVERLHSAIRFVNLVSWGFCPELNDTPWRGRLGDWPAAGTPAAKIRRRHRLKPRR